MKKFKFFFILSFLITPFISFGAISISYDEIPDKILSQNFSVKENALKVRIAKQSVSAAKAGLLPKLNIWKLAKGVIDFGSLIEGAGDLLPFMVPNNWFRLQEKKISLLSEKEGYRALVSNEVLSAKLIYLNLFIAQSVLDDLKVAREEIKELYSLAKLREFSGSLPSGSSNHLKVHLYGIEEDIRNLELSLGESLLNFTLALGMETSEAVDLSPVALDDLGQMSKIEADKLEYRVLDSAPELRQLDHFLEIIPYLKNEVAFSIFGESTINRGELNDIYKNLPQTDGLGFGLIPSMKIVKSNKEMIDIQKIRLEEVLKRKFASIVNRSNSMLNAWDTVEERSVLADGQINSLFSRMRLGEENIDVLEFLERIEDRILARTSLYLSQYGYLIEQERVNRLVFAEDFADFKPAILEVN